MPPLWHAIQISPGFTISDWLATRNRLDPLRLDESWRDLIERIRTRVEKRFLEPVQLLLNEERLARRDEYPEGLGFTVLAIDCLLIETLCGYENGARTNVGQTASTFEEFLKSAAGFADFFGEGDRAADFARSVRNGVLHDGEARNGWIVWERDPDGKVGDDLGEGVRVVYRSAFHEALVDYQDSYFDRLLETGNADLRANLKQRLDSLASESGPK